MKPLFIFALKAVCALGGMFSLAHANEHAGKGAANQPVVQPETESVSAKFHLYTRVTAATWPKLQKFAREGDLFWGRDLSAVPPLQRALLITSFSHLQRRLKSADIAEYAAVNLDGEYRDTKEALADVKRIRDWVDQHNCALPHDASIPALKFTAFFHMRIIDEEPDIVRFPDVVMIGKSFWKIDTITNNAARVRRPPQRYLELIRAAGREPGVLLGSPEKAAHHAGDILRTWQACLRPATEEGWGLHIVGFYYERDEVEMLLTVLSQLRPGF